MSARGRTWRHKYLADSWSGCKFDLHIQNQNIYYLLFIAFFFQGTLKGFDQTINLILDESHERVFSSSQGVEQVVLGLYIVRGDNV